MTELFILFGGTLVIMLVVGGFGVWSLWNNAQVDKYEQEQKKAHP